MTPTPQHRKRKILIALACFIGVSVAGVRIYYEFVPRGVSFISFTGYSRQLPSITSPNGKTYQVFVNDAGAMHSGNYWTWVIDNHLLTGRYVVSEGYITSEYSTVDSDLIVEWDGDIPNIPFEKGRY